MTRLIPSQTIWRFKSFGGSGRRISSQPFSNHVGPCPEFCYRWVSIRKAASRDTHAEHIALKDAVLARDKATAERLIHDHFVETTRIIIANDPSTQDEAEALIGKLKAEIRSALE